MGNSSSRDMGDGGVGAGAASEALGTTEIKTNINQLVNQDKVVIFSKTSCPYCFDAKEVFDKIGQKYTVVELNNHPQGPQVQDALKEMTGARTVPRVFVNGQCIGGGSDTVNMYKTGNLEKILSKETILSETQ